MTDRTNPSSHAARSMDAGWGVGARAAAILATAVLASASLAQAEPPVQWPVAAGGNGHWYQRVAAPEGIAWTVADAAARAAGGHLVTISGEAEQDWILGNFITGQPACGGGDAARALWIGLRQDAGAPDFAEPAGGWRWVTGEPLDFSLWAKGEPNDGDGGSNVAAIRLAGAWDDAPGSGDAACVRGYLVEWSADCDGDGEVDLGQILAGALADANGNGVPDCCEGSDAATDDCNANGLRDACELVQPGADVDADRVLDECERAFGDLDLDGEIGAPDLASLLAGWGACASASACADLNADGLVDAQDLTILLSRWGVTPPWLLPVIESVTPADGPLVGGTLVTISGRNLADAASVTIGGAGAASVTPIDARTITAVTPAGTLGARDVAVVTPRGVAVAAGAFTYVAPAPVLTSLAPAGGPTSGGTLVTLTGANFSAPLSITVGGVAATAVNVVSPTSATFVAPAGSVGPADVVATTSVGTATLPAGFRYVLVPTWATLLEALPDAAIVTNADNRSAILATGRPWRVRHTTSQIELVLIPPGSFSMGCSPSATYACEADESPVHAVTIANPFYMGRVEVTQAQWVASMGSNPSYHGGSASANRPVEQVSWTSAQNFLALHGMRLPSEAEWEHAYRAGTQTAFHAFGAFPNGTNDDAQVPNIGWIISNSFNSTKTVGQKSPNGFGLHDMSGNVWEWVSDWYLETYYGWSPTGSPRGPASGTNRGARGGSFDWNATEVRSSRRGYALPSSAFYELGLRVVKDVGNLPLPFVQNISPASGAAMSTTTVTLSGLHFTGVTSVTVGGAPASITSSTTTSITASVPPAAAGIKDLVVTTAAGSSVFPNGFFHLSSPPTIESISPTNGPTTTGRVVTITGSNFAAPLTVRFGSVNASASSTTVLSPTQVRVTVPGQAAGTYDVQVTTAAGTATLPGGYTYVSLPVISSVTPNGGPLSGGTQITITGANFVGSTSVRVGGVNATGVVVVSPTTIVATTPPQAAAGPQSVQVTSVGGNRTVNDAFTYWPAPTFTAISPAIGPVAGGAPVTLTGTNFFWTPEVRFGGVPAANVVVTSATSLTAFTPPGALGTVDVTLTTLSGSSTIPNAYSYVGAPTIASTFPDNGPVSGGTDVEITGERFFPPIYVTIGGLPATNVVVVSPNRLIARTQPSVVGTGDVVVTTLAGTATVAAGYTYTTNWYSVLDQLPDPAVVTKESLRQAIIAVGKPWRIRDHASKIELLLIPPGSFDMGCAALPGSSCGPSNTPVHHVTLTKAFYLGRYELTHEEWGRVMGEAIAPGFERRPRTQINVPAFLATSGFVLPTEAEWEYAYRAGTSTNYHSMPGYPDGFNENDPALVSQIAFWTTTPPFGPATVGLRQANAFGLHDMAGNLSEWTNDWYSETYYATSPSVDPTGPPGPVPPMNYRVHRGGSYNDAPAYGFYAAHARGLDVNFNQSSYIGVRVVKRLAE